MKHTTAYRYTSIFGCLILLFLAACKSKPADTNASNFQTLLHDTINEVQTQTLQTTSFQHELISNGKIKAKTIAELKFQTTEVIQHIYVHNGTTVHKGQVLAALDTYKLQAQLKQAKDAVERTQLDLQDVLIGQGYKLDQSDRVPQSIMHLAEVKSGYNQAKMQEEEAAFRLKQAHLVAPISGIVANLFSKPHTLSSPSEVFCHIIDTQSLEVEFTVLESELAYIQIGNSIQLSPFSMPELQVAGKIIELNPWVDQNGMVQIKASVTYHPQLVEGMNAKVSIFRNLDQQWVVPKSAVVLRTGRPVVFSVQDNKAIWNYVTTGLENATHYTISSKSLQEGDQIIVSGNINLAHDSPVSIVQNNTHN